MTRRSIEIEGFHHANPIPGASRVGPLLASSVIAARDPGSDRVPEDADGQIANLFHHVEEMLRTAGADWRHVVKMNFYVPDIKMRSAINAPWLERFPDPDSRPARHTQADAERTDCACDFLAYVDD
jgi:2-iminobutanoate/2-iminopropanoate deaminase